MNETLTLKFCRGYRIVIRTEEVSENRWRARATIENITPKIPGREIRLLSNSTPKERRTKRSKSWLKVKSPIYFNSLTVLVGL
jgi:hypothetical protein